MSGAEPPVPPGPTGPPPNPRRDRQRALAAFLQGALVVATLLGIAALVVPEAVHRALAIAMVVVLVGVPVVRVGWLVVRWARRRDWRFVAAGTALLTVLALGLVLSFRGV
ncbi:MAG: hypothetical protein R2726_09785 [Acidimicrobiales bacterium]